MTTSPRFYSMHWPGSTEMAGSRIPIHHHGLGRDISTSQYLSFTAVVVRISSQHKPSTKLALDTPSPTRPSRTGARSLHLLQRKIRTTRTGKGVYPNRDKSTTPGDITGINQPSHQSRVEASRVALSSTHNTSSKAGREQGRGARRLSLATRGWTPALALTLPRS